MFFSKRFLAQAAKYIELLFSNFCTPIVMSCLVIGLVGLHERGVEWAFSGIVSLAVINTFLGLIFLLTWRQRKKQAQDCVK